MARNRQRELTLAAVAVALISIAMWRLQSGASAPPAPPPQADAAASSATSSKPKSATAEVDLQSLQADRPEPVDTNRNPFTFKPKPQPPPSPSPRDPGGQQRSPSGMTPPSEPPQPARIPMKFIGIIHSSDPKLADIAVLSDGRGVYQGRVNEIIEGRYRILRIGIESIELAYLDGRGSQTISLTGQ